jgi:hypothetical protein
LSNATFVAHDAEQLETCGELHAIGTTALEAR